MGIWSQVGQKLIGERSDISFGDSIALSSLGSKLAVGSPAMFSRSDVKGSVQLYELKLVEAHV